MFHDSHPPTIKKLILHPFRMMQRKKQRNIPRILCKPIFNLTILFEPEMECQEVIQEVLKVNFENLAGLTPIFSYEILFLFFLMKGRRGEALLDLVQFILNSLE